MLKTLIMILVMIYAIRILALEKDRVFGHGFVEQGTSIVC